MTGTDNFYMSQEEPNQSCLLALRNIILGQDENVSESIKYGAPCFSYRNKMFCFLWIDKKAKTPYILFVEGLRIMHPKLEQGNRKRMKIYRIDPSVDLDINTIDLLLSKALELYRNGTIKVK